MARVAQELLATLVEEWPVAEPRGAHLVGDEMSANSHRPADWPAAELTWSSLTVRSTATLYRPMPRLPAHVVGSGGDNAYGVTRAGSAT